jgi:uncharacterized membrane protein HdeD (DUF308 family)
MSLLSESEPAEPRFADALSLRRWWVLFLVLGIVLILLGVAAIAAAPVASITTVLVFGILLVAGGAVQIVNAIPAREWSAFFLHLLAGMLHLIVGGLMIEHPVLAAEALTLMLAVAFLVGGTLRILYVLFERFPGWPWVLLNGIVTFVLGMAVWRQWPDSSLWVIGLFVGIDLIFNGWSWVMLALIVKAAGARVK